MSTNGVDFVIGGKDNAKPAMASVEQSLSRLEKKADSLGSATSKLTMLTGALASAYAAFKSAMAMLAGLDKINAAYDQQAEAISGLNVALKLQGASVEIESARLQKFADDIQRLTGINDEETMAMLKQASIRGVAADQLDDMAKAAIGLSEAIGVDASTAMDMMRNATDGQFTSFSRAIPLLKTMTTDEEKLAAVLDLSRRGLEAKSEWAGKVAQSGAGAATAMDKLYESVGAIIAPFRALLSTGIETVANALTHLLSPAVENAEAMLENLGPTMDWLRDKTTEVINEIIYWFTFFEVVITNLDSVWTIMVSQAELYLLQMAGAVMHTLTEVIPAYVIWFAENLINLHRDAFTGIVTIARNALAMLVEIFMNWWHYAFVDMDADATTIGEILGRGLLTGFESSLTNLPDVAARTISDREKDLTETIGQVGANLGDEFSRKFGERMVGMGDGISDEFSKDIDLKVNSAVDDALGKTKGPGGGSGEKSINAMESRLLTRGPANSFSLAEQFPRLIESVRDMTQAVVAQADFVKAGNEKLGFIEENTSNTVQMVPVQ